MPRSGHAELITALYGGKWIAGIHTASSSYLAVVLVLSPESVRAHWVKQEVSFANRRRKRFLPVLHRVTDVPNDIDLAMGRVHLLDLTSHGYREGVAKLVDALRKLEACDSDSPDEPIDEAPPWSFTSKTLSSSSDKYRAESSGGSLASGARILMEKATTTIALRPWSALIYWTSLAGAFTQVIGLTSVMNDVSLAQIPMSGVLKLSMLIGATASVPAVIVGLAKRPMSSFKTGEKAFLYIGMQGGRYKAMFKLQNSMLEATRLAKKDPSRCEIGSNSWVTARFTAEAPMPKKLWEKWLDESYALCLTTGSEKPSTVTKTSKKKVTKRPATRKDVSKKTKRTNRGK